MRQKLRLAVTALALAAPVPALAHPHVFVESRLEIISDGKGAVSELRNVWRFDEVFSSGVILDFDRNADLKLDEAELAEIAEIMRNSLADFDYFTNIAINGRKITVEKPPGMHLMLEGGQLILLFTLKPKEKIALDGKLTFGIYDPTLYTAVDFPTDGDLATQGKGFAACTRKVVRPDPDEVIAENSNFLTDAFFNDPAGNDMTRLLATRLELTC